jgi:hypothetical protein
MNLPKLRFTENDGKAFPDWEWQANQHMTIQKK